MAQPAPQAPPPSPLYPPAPPYAAPPPPKKSRTALYAVLAVVVVIVVVLIALAASGAFSPKAPASNNSPPPPPPVIVTVVTSGTVWNLNAGYYEDVGPIDLTSNSSWTISGSFTASNGITAYVMTSSEYSAWGGSGSPSAYYWTSGSSVTSGSVNTNLPSGTYYFVWDNTNSFTSTSVQITSNVIATSSG